MLAWECILLHDDGLLLGGVGGWPRAALPRRLGGEGLPLVEPGLLPPVRRLNMAWAPKLMRLVNGVFGAVRAPPMSSSSTAFSSIESGLLLVDTLDRRKPKGGGLVGDVPDRPKVEMDRRRRWSFMAAVVMGPGKTWVLAEAELLL